MNLIDQNYYKWIKLKHTEIQEAVAIGDQLYPTLQEDIKYYQEKLSLFPKGCLALKYKHYLCGYIIAHPWILFNSPKMNSYLIKLPYKPNCMHIHDIAILPEHRGRQLSHLVLRQIERICQQAEIKYISITSVNRTTEMWRKLGFRELDTTEQKPDINEYGIDAEYMIKPP